MRSTNNLNLFQKHKVVLIFCLFTLIFFRFDINYKLWPHRVKTSETLWSILDEKVFHNPSITGISLNYLKAQSPQFDWNHIEKNENGQGGYIINVWFNKLNIRGPNSSFVIKDASILSQVALKNHVMEVITYDLLVVSLSLFIYANLKENNFKLGLRFFKDTVLIPAFLSFGAVIIIITVFFLYGKIAIFLRPNPVDIFLITPQRAIFQK